MPLNEQTIADLALRLESAEQDRKQIGHFSAEYPEMTIEDGYRVQRAWVGRKLAGGRTRIGYKIGLTSRAMQRSSQIDEPDYGSLLDDMLFPNNGDVPVGRFIEPRVEVELAFILRERLSGPSCTIFDVLRATDYVVPAVEIIDARIQRLHPDNGKARQVMDTISDNAANAGIILGGRPVKPDAVDLRWVGALIHKNGVIEDSGVAAAVLGNPAMGVAWLANKLAPWSETLEPGHIVLGGSFTAPVFGAAGDTFHVDYGPLGSISFRFAA